MSKKKAEKKTQKRLAQMKEVVKQRGKEKPSPANNYAWINAKSLAKMTDSERHRYYFWLYQQTGRVFGAMVELRPNDTDSENWPKIRKMTETEWWYYCTANSALLTMMDAFAGLETMLAEHDDWSESESFSDWNR